MVPSAVQSELDEQSVCVFLHSPFLVSQVPIQGQPFVHFDMEHSLCYFSRYLAGYEGLKEAGAATVYRMLSGPVTNKECPRPSIKWVASLTAHTAADRCRKWLGGEEEDDESDPDE